MINFSLRERGNMSLKDSKPYAVFLLVNICVYTQAWDELLYLTYIFLYLLFFSFRLGKMYIYEQNYRDLGALQSFAETWYRNMKARQIPLDPTPLYVSVVYLFICFFHSDSSLFTFESYFPGILYNKYMLFLLFFALNNLFLFIVN